MTHEPLTILFICDEWSSAKGGISVVNRRLAIACARRDHTVIALVSHATDADRVDAIRYGVRLVLADRTPAGPDLHLPVAEVLAMAPDVVVGHDRVTGHIAWLYARRYSRAVWVHIMHTAPAEIEPYKHSGAATARVEVREAYTLELAAEADIVAAVGPRLANYTAHLLDDGFGGRPVVQLNPGLDDPEVDDRVRHVPARPTVMVLGRTEDAELKGLDIAAGAVAGLARRPGHRPPVLFVRGAPMEQCDELRTTLVGLSGIPRDRVDVRPFTMDPAAVRRDLRRAALSVLPSRAEGFGLAVWEALAAGTPVLISSQSGAADLLRECPRIPSDNLIVDVIDKPDHDVGEWISAMQRVLDDLPTAFAEAHRIRGLLRDQFSWAAAADALLSGIRPPTTRADTGPHPSVAR